jgi:hypothetical protein
MQDANRVCSYPEVRHHQDPGITVGIGGCPLDEKLKDEKAER